MNGNPIGMTICGLVALVGIMTLLFCLLCTISSAQDGEAVGVFLLAALFCCILIGAVLLIGFA